MYSCSLNHAHILARIGGEFATGCEHDSPRGACGERGGDGAGADHTRASAYHQAAGEATSLMADGSGATPGSQRCCTKVGKARIDASLMCLLC